MLWSNPKNEVWTCTDCPWRLNAEANGCSRRMRTWLEVWLRCGSVNARMASGYGTRGGGPGGLRSQPIGGAQRSAAERGAAEGGGGRALKFAIENGDPRTALYRNDFLNAFGVPAPLTNFPGPFWSSADQASARPSKNQFRPHKKQLLALRSRKSRNYICPWRYPGFPLGVGTSRWLSGAGR
jgi:hypothetical protein